MKLREMRLKLKLTQTELAEALKIPQATISRWESDAMAIQQPEILKLAMEHLRCPKKARTKPRA